MAAAFGGYLALFRGLRTDNFAVWLIVLTLVGGVAAVYLWKPSIFPDHFWASRRFAPVVIPGCILFAALAFQEAVGWFPERILWEAGAVVFLGWFAFTAFRPFWLLAEHRGMYAGVSHLARNVPPAGIVFGQGSMRWIVPLAVTFDRKVVPIDFSSKTGETALRLYATRFAKHQPIYVVADSHIQVSGFASVELERATLVDQYIEETTNPLPTRVVRQNRFVYVFQLVKKSES